MSDKRTKAQVLVGLVTQYAELFHDEDMAFATVANVTVPVKSQKFRSILRSTYYAATQDVPSAEAFLSAINTIDALAVRQSPQLKTFVRVAEADGCIFIDLANEWGQVVKISPKGWSVISDSPVKFIRAAGLKSLPTPLQNDGDFAALRTLLNVKMIRRLR
jgi:hypothetical protein